MPKARREDISGKGFFFRLTFTVSPHFFYRLTSHRFMLSIDFYPASINF